MFNKPTGVETSQRSHDRAPPERDEDMEYTTVSRLEGILPVYLLCNSIYCTLCKLQYLIQTMGMVGAALYDQT